MAMATDPSKHPTPCNCFYHEYLRVAEQNKRRESEKAEKAGKE